MIYLTGFDIYFYVIQSETVKKMSLSDYRIKTCICQTRDTNIIGEDDPFEV